MRWRRIVGAVPALRREPDGAPMVSALGCQDVTEIPLTLALSPKGRGNGKHLELLARGEGMHHLISNLHFSPSPLRGEGWGEGVVWFL
jgi:hypothetical protein